MELSPIQLEIQKFSDQSLSFGCIVKYNWEIHRLVSYRKHTIENKPFEDINIWRWVNFHAWESFIQYNYWHPMTYGRLMYLRHINILESGDDTIDARFKIDNLFMNNPEQYNQTVLEWDKQTQVVVRDFLLSLPKDA